MLVLGPTRPSAVTMARGPRNTGLNIHLWGLLKSVFGEVKPGHQADGL